MEKEPKKGTVQIDGASFTYTPEAVSYTHLESTLAQIYKRRNPETGESYGGPAYYIEAALHSRPLAVLFALSLIHISS